MQEITQKLHKKVMDEFLPIAEELASSGYNKDYIVAAFQKQLKLKVNQYYGEKHSAMTHVGDLLGDYETLVKSQIPADSKAEQVFYNLLCERGMRFKFQYNIGPYRVDYLFSGYLVVELDGPQHSKTHDDARDAYMRRMGYKIIRVPIWILVSCPEAVIEEIQEAIKCLRLVPGKNKP